MTAPAADGRRVKPDGIDLDIKCCGRARASSACSTDRRFQLSELSLASYTR
jgi:hypothetical protein